MKKLFSFFLSWFLLSVLNAQMLPYEKYTSKNGLISDRITAIAQDEKGFMWFGSYFGICRYNGNKFEKIELPPKQSNKYVNCLLSAQNKIYAGFLFGGGLAEIGEGKVNSYFIKSKDSIGSNEFICITEEDDGGILLANIIGQVYSFKNGQFKYLTSLPLQRGIVPHCIQKDKANIIWIATGQGLYLLSPPYTHPKIYFPGENVFSLVKDEEGKIWFSRTDGKRTIIHCAEAPKGNLTDSKNSFISSTISAVPFSGLSRSGIWQIDLAKGLTHTNNSETYYYHIPFDFTTDISTIFADRENNIWIANEPGVFKVSNFNIRTYLFQEMAAAGGSLCFVNDSLLCASNSKSFYSITPSGIAKKLSVSKNSDYYGLLHTDKKGNLWIGFWENGIIQSKWKNGSPYTIKKYDRFRDKQIKAKAIVEDNNGNIWIGGINGIFRIRNGEIVETFQPVNSSGYPAFITCMTLDDETKTLWIGDNALGVIKVNYEPKVNGPYQYKITGYIGPKEGLTDGYIRSICFDQKKKLWIGTRYGGIYRIEKPNEKHMAILCNQDAQLSCTRITDIVSQDSTATWFATCDGIYRYKYSDNRWTHFNTSDGLLNAEVFNIIPSPDHNFIYALTAQGVTKLQLSDEQRMVAPIVSIVSVNILGKPDTVALLSEETKRYSYSQNSIGFNFVGASFIDERKVSYRYMLEGYDKDWSAPTLNNTIHYASLPPGKYNFKVMAANAKGQWSQTPAVFQFVITMPFYRNPWFIFSIITIGLLIFYFIRIGRLKQKFKIEKIRLAIARDLHDDVGSTLGSINLLSQTASRRLDNNSVPEEIKPLFNKIGQSAENTLEAMDDIVWSINPGKDKAYDLVIRMREFAFPLLEAKNIVFDFVVEGNADQSLPMNLRRNLFLIFKEAIYNIVKHSQASKADIKIHISPKNILMNIKDNGNGFVANGTSNRNGLKNLYSRAETIGASIKIDSCPSGTSVAFTAPVR